MIPHNTRKYRAILNLSYTLKQMEHIIEADSNTMNKPVPHGAMDQMVYNVLDRIICTYAEAKEDKGGRNHIRNEGRCI